VPEIRENWLELIRKGYEKKRRVWNYEDPKFIRYVRNQYRGFIENREDSLLNSLYKKINFGSMGRKGRLKKFQFFIYWLSLALESKRAESQIDDHLEKEKHIKVTFKDKIDYILEELFNEFDFPSLDDGLHFKYGDKIRSRYKKKKSIEDELVHLEIFDNLSREIEKNSQSKKLLSQSLEMWPELMTQIDNIKKDAKKRARFKEKILNYLDQKKEVSFRELSRKFSKRYSDLIFPLRSLYEESLIDQDEKSGIIFPTKKLP
jgi:hypothetical protein